MSKFLLQKLKANFSCFSHLLYLKDGEKRLRMKFYVSGSRKRATVHLEMREVSMIQCLQNC